MIRGGSWNNNPANVRVANRNNRSPDNANNNLGVRLARSAPVSPPTRHASAEQARLRWPRATARPPPRGPGGHLVIALHELVAASRATCRGKRRRADVAEWLLREGEEVVRLHEALASGAWRPAIPDLLFLRDPKPRVIVRAPVRDRVVHTAIVAAIEPAWRRVLVPGDLACRPGGGTHRAVFALMRAMRRHPHVLHLDVRAYFPSIDPIGTLALVRRRVGGPWVDVLEHVLRAGTHVYDDPLVRRHLHLGDTWPPRGRGLPVGAHTSQFLAAHVVLGDLDSRLLRTLRVGDYVRYVDDLFLFGRRKDLDRWRLDIEWWLQVERGLRLKHADAPVLPTAGPLDALGHRITRGGAVALPEAMRRLRTALRQSGDGPVDGGRLRASMASRVDWALPK